ncbi:MAG: polyribonucleotide nucleotidyltransferase [Deltaproteobacteria bacterium]|nr:polyribonucleotide nucleotidyltransferase [Deltaproteobacteria bacterium]
MNQIFKASFAGGEISLKINYLAGQADGGVLVTYGDTVVLVTVVSAKSRREGLDFMPLTVDYQEMTFAAGKIPGGFFKREGRPNEREILTSRIIDRAIRPLFPDGYRDETQLVATVLSLDNENDPGVAAMLGASVALQIASIPFEVPIAGARVGRIDGKYVCNPMGKQMEDSDIDIFMVGRKVVPGTGGRPFDINLVMVEGGAREIDEDAAVGAIRFGLESIRPLIEIQEEIRKAAGKPKKVVEAIQIDGNLRQKVVSATEKKMREAYVIPVKQTRHTTLGKIREEILSQMTAEDPKLGPQINYVLEELEKKILREMILQQKRRIDGRSNTDIRPISCEVGILPRTHGSALFTRGETQALVSITLGTSSDEQRMDYAAGEEYRAFMLHYNFPPYCVGEVRPLRGPGRREIGHGALARRALLPLLPTQEEFPYTMRIVSDILSSNGSSSMASVCGGALCLMDAGVPVKGVTAGIAMGLLKEGENVVVLSDILGDEDHAGDMDFKVCGTERGITAMQMDIKIDGITEDILGKALHQAREGRLFIIGKIKETIDKPRESLSVYAPRITMIKVKPDRIRDVIGTGGKNIRQIISETGVSIDVEDDGTVMIASNDAEAAERAIAMVRWLTEEAEIGKIYLGTVKKVVDFGAFVEILPGTEGLVHISQLDTKRVNKVTDVVKEGDKVPVKVIEIDRSGKIRLSRKDALGENVPKNHPR